VRLLVPCLVLMLAACGKEPGPAPQPDASVGASSGDAPSDAPLPGLPAQFAGELPCADCPGIWHVLDIYPDGTFAYRLTFHGRGDDGAGESHDDIGRWALQGSKLALRGGREAPVFFALRGAEAIDKLDLEGNPIESALNYTLTRSSEFEPMEPELHMRGMYRYMADAALFEECITGWRLPVSMEGDNLALERGYAEARTSPGDAVLVSLTGRIAQRRAMEGDGTVRSLVPVRFVNAWPGQTCSPAAAFR
jgi:copper homeostasis protein (lipoprotein)